MFNRSISKKCSKCKIIKSLSEFYKNNSNKYGYQSWCKSCKNDCQNQYRKTEKGRILRQKQSLRYYTSEKGKNKYRKYSRIYRIQYPEKRKAMDAVKYAIRIGKLPRPDYLKCHYCQEPAQEYHHHLGYAPEHWLDVVSVCILCHRKNPYKSSTPGLFFY